MLKNFGGVALAAAVILLGGAAQAQNLATAYTSDSEYLAALAADPVVEIGTGVLRWGNPASTAAADWEYGILDSKGALIGTGGQYAWKKGNTLFPANGVDPLTKGSTTLPFISYTASGQLGLAFRPNTVSLTAQAMVGTGVNTIIVHSALASNGAPGSVSLLQLSLSLFDGTSYGAPALLGSTFADKDGEYLVFSDDQLAQGFKITYPFGFFNNYTAASTKWVNPLPLIEVTLGWRDLGTGNSYSIIGQGGTIDAGPPAFDIENLISAPGQLALAAVPEPSSWALLIAGFGLVGGALRRRGGAPAIA